MQSLRVNKINYVFCKKSKYKTLVYKLLKQYLIKEHVRGELQVVYEWHLCVRVGMRILTIVSYLKP